ncbi:MAG: DUF2079 domain-containing protein [Elusimicrobia bacterium]|nr:DUF2079 domain-containing protein [Elusimicrobiota bacterium]
MWPYRVSYALEWLWRLLGLGCLIAAALLAAKPGLLERVESALDRVQRSRSLRPAPLVFLAVVPPLVGALFKVLQYHGFELGTSSAANLNVLWNLAHGYGPFTDMEWYGGGVNFLSLHLSFTILALAPALRLWESPLLPVAAHGLVVASTPLAAYLLAAGPTRRPLAGWLAAAVAAANPLLHSCLQTIVCSWPFEAPLVLWSAHLWQAGRRRLAAVTGLLLLTTGEHAPFILGGWGLFLLLTRDRRAPAWPCWLLVLGSPLLWGLELWIMKALGAPPELGDQWTKYPYLGGSLPAAAATALTRPWLILWNLVYPPEKLWTILRTLLGAALVPLGSGPALLPLATAWLPQQLATAGTMFHGLYEHYASFVLGPLLWSFTQGLARLLRAADPARARLLAAAVLAAAGINFLDCTTQMLRPGLMPSAWHRTVPRALAHIPQRASVWSDGFLSPHVALRRSLHALPLSRRERFFDTAFVPDRVLLSAHWIPRAEPEVRERILGYLARERFVELFREGDLVVLANPNTLGKEGAPPRPLRL